MQKEPRRTARNSGLLKGENITKSLFFQSRIVLIALKTF
jgi:hypothetical protein